MASFEDFSGCALMSRMSCGVSEKNDVSAPGNEGRDRQQAHRDRSRQEQTDVYGVECDQTAFQIRLFFVLHCLPTDQSKSEPPFSCGGFAAASPSSLSTSLRLVEVSTISSAFARPVGRHGQLRLDILVTCRPFAQHHLRHGPQRRHGARFDRFEHRVLFAGLRGEDVGWRDDRFRGALDRRAVESRRHDDQLDAPPQLRFDARAPDDVGVVHRAVGGPVRWRATGCISVSPSPRPAPANRRRRSRCSAGCFSRRI